MVCHSGPTALETNVSLSYPFLSALFSSLSAVCSSVRFAVQFGFIQCVRRKLKLWPCLIDLCAVKACGEVGGVFICILSCTLEMRQSSA